MAIINPSELDLKEETVVRIKRIAKVTSRGKRFRFSAVVVIGDGQGHVGVGVGKAGFRTLAAGQQPHPGGNDVVPVGDGIGI